MFALNTLIARSSPPSLAIACALLVLGAAQVSARDTAGASNPRNHAMFYVSAYGEVDASHNDQTATAHRVFERVRAAADQNRNRCCPC